MKSIQICAACLLSFVVATSYAQGAIERATGVAAAAAVLAPTTFRSECEASATNVTEKQFCAMRAMAAGRGADFMQKLRLEELALGRQRKVDTFLATKQYGESIYDACLLRHGDEIERSASFSVADSICKLEKADAFAGMRLFNMVVASSGS